jgi:hypothetical protein
MPLKLNSERILLGFFIILNIIPIVTGFAFINLFAVDVPYHDQFHQEIPEIIKYYDGTFSISDFLALNNDHRPIFVHILTFFLDKVTRVNNIIEVNVGYLLHVSAFIILWFLFKRSLPDLRPLSLYMIPVSWFFFNLYLISAYLWGILLSSSLCLLALVSMVYLLEMSNKYDLFFGGAVIAAIVGMFSWVAGIFLWPAGFIQIILSNSVHKIKKIVTWSIVTAAILYFNYIFLKFTPTGVHGYEGYYLYVESFVHFPLHKSILIIESLGSNIIHSYIDSVIFGVLLLAILIFILINERDVFSRPGNAPWLAILFFSFLVHITLVLARSGEGDYFGPANNLFFLPAVRHFPSTFMFVIGLYGLVLHTYHWNLTHDNDKYGEILAMAKPKISRSCTYCILLGFVAAVMFSGCILHFQSGVFYGVLWAEKNYEYRLMFINYNNVNDSVLNGLLVDRYTLQKLDQYNLSVFKSSSFGLYPQWLPDGLRQKILNSPYSRVIEFE